MKYLAVGILQMYMYVKRYLFEKSAKINKACFGPN